MPAPVATATQETRPIRPDRKRGLMYGIVGGVLALGLLAAVLLGLLVLSNDGNGDGDESDDVASLNEAETETQVAINDSLTATESTSPTTSPPPVTSTPEATATDEPTPTDVPPSATDIPPTNAPLPTTEVPPTAVPPTQVPPTAVPTTAVPPTPVPPTAALPTAVQATPVPTEAYPNGRLFRMLYDNNTFVVSNTSSTNFQTNLIGFEALLADGSVATLSNGDPIEVAGTEWSRFYGLLEPNKCLTAQISSSRPWLQPSECRNYNSVITPSRTGNRQFWLPRETIAVTEIRVLYQGQEAARCPLHTGAVAVTVCEVKLP